MTTPRKRTRKAVTAEDVAAAALAAREASAALEAAMVAYRKTGASMGQVAEAAGYSKPGVLSMLRRHGVA